MYIIFHLNLDVINLCQIMVDLVSGCQIMVYRKKEFKKSNMYIIFLCNLGEENGGPLEKSFSIVGPASLQKESSYRVQTCRTQCFDLIELYILEKITKLNN